MTLVSVLCPTRGRPLGMRESVKSLLGQARDPGRVEVLAGVDADDEETIYLSDLHSDPGIIRTCVFPQRLGYARIHEYYNRLAEMAQGKWLLLWNDDCTMITPGWDEIIAEQPPAVLWPQADFAPGINTFPVIPAAWVRHLGHVSLDQSCDFWWHDLGERLGVLRKIPAEIHHEQPDDATTAEKIAVANVNTFHTAQMQEARDKDAARLLELTG